MSTMTIAMEPCTPSLGDELPGPAGTRVAMEVSRKRVVGGWIVYIRREGEDGLLLDVPDPGHEWTGAVVAVPSWSIKGMLAATITKWGVPLVPSLVVVPNERLHHVVVNGDRTTVELAMTNIGLPPAEFAITPGNGWCMVTADTADKERALFSWNRLDPLAVRW